ncbi:NAD(P)H-dependent oxidoreductase subunit E [Chelatococcus reniformis]|uniref:NADH-quinone oxidoreductase subunit E n=1 Tax=Chelatococcus reniformis TaxID=1494448 RepID=A0A916TZ24_9HYPH|nr:NAD(P)H-dependent oxidoreductase subunit E [Chelatococcus reniformis]GGC53367.1 NADH-quinone oxidoreductase subunit E [Chelatococcus reniformis]
MGGYAPWNADVAQQLVARLSGLEGAMLPVLHALQEEFGYIDSAAVPLIADALNVSRAEVHGAITFYDDFREGPPPARIIKLCRAEACQALGCESLVAELARSRGIVVDQHGAADLVVETVYCLGNCALGPAALVGDQLIGRLDAPRLMALCDGAAPARVQELPPGAAGRAAP